MTDASYRRGVDLKRIKRRYFLRGGRIIEPLVVMWAIGLSAASFAGGYNGASSAGAFWPIAIAAGLTSTVVTWIVFAAATTLIAKTYRLFKPHCSRGDALWMGTCLLMIGLFVVTILCQIIVTILVLLDVVD